MKETLNELALFAGAGGGLLATKHLLGWNTICYVEWNEYCVEVIKARIRDGYLDDAPIWDDVQTFDGTPWRGCVDIITAGFPCQPFSGAGDRMAKGDPRNMWPDTIRIIAEVRPQWVLLENVPTLLCGSHGYYGQVLRDLAESGYDAQWRVLSAADVGAPHLRDRLWVVAYPNGERSLSSSTTISSTRPTPIIHNGQRFGGIWAEINGCLYTPDRLRDVIGIFRDDDGMAHRVDQLKTIGNGQVPAVVAAVWRLLTQVP